ncbi:MAG: hypothetical protein KBA87_00760 [Lachnospiraceae bacterium]|jgi:vacuolar-type H+-ATPase subunit H|nr:hypothetical protein [Lachnospiraceae bacterium]
MIEETISAVKDAEEKARVSVLEAKEQAKQTEKNTELVINDLKSDAKAKDKAFYDDAMETAEKQGQHILSESDERSIVAKQALIGDAKPKYEAVVEAVVDSLLNTGR